MSATRTALVRAPRVSLTWRVALLSGVAVAVLGGLTLLVAYLTVRAGLYEDVRRGIKDDAAAVAEIYSGGAGTAEANLSGPTGKVIIQVYDSAGRLLAASRPEFERALAALPGNDVRGAVHVATSWQGLVNGRRMEVALAPFELGVVAVLVEPSHIAPILAELSRKLLLAAVALALISLAVGYAVASAALRPVARLARVAGRLGPENLDEIRYEGPADEVGRLAVALNGLLTRLRAALDAQRVFIAETSHELRTPLTSLHGFLDRAVRKAPPGARDDILDAERIAGSMTRLVQDLLQLSKGELVREHAVHLVDLGADVVRPVADEFPGVRAEVVPAALVLGDPGRLNQAVRNLVSNAVRAAGRPDGVLVELIVEGGHGTVRVTDDGPGIPQESRERVFEKFYKGAGGGSGLGLAITRQIAEHHDGSLTFESEPGRTAFELRLPLVEADDD